MLAFIKNHIKGLITFAITAGLIIFIWGCPSTTTSLLHNDRKVTRPELQLELENITALARLRITDLNQQDELKSLLVQNALIIFDGQPLNPLGLLTGVAAIYGIASGGYQIGGKVNTKVKERKVKNGTV